MMDIQRLIALVVFSFSALLLWDAWQKHNAPKQVPAPASVTTPSAVPKPSTSLETTTPPAATHATSPQPPSAGAAAVSGGEPIVVHTDMMDVELSTMGGDIRRVTLDKVRSADNTKPLTLMEPDPKHFFTTQTGLLGEGLPSHKTLYEADSKSYTLAPNEDKLEVRLRARDASGVEVVKHLTFHRGTYVVDVTYEVANKTGKPIASYAYFQFLRDGNPPSSDAAQTSHFGGVSTFTGPAVFTE